jgi:protein-S-isoprenylcysteine O-methyltransferase Ste14
MERLILFGILSIPILVLSWRSMLNLRNHGFYRFFSWECIVWLFVNNFRCWFTNPFSITQIFSWVFLIISGYLVIAGVILMKKIGKPNKSRDGKSLYQFEKTSELVDVGVFKYIRHPLYSSLLFLTWGIFLKNPEIILLIVALFSSLMLYLTARYDEKECMQYFGDKYNHYMKRTKMFIPFLF